MKAHPIAALLALGFVTAASAQSGLVLSGIADLAVRRVTNDGSGSTTSVVSGSNNTSRLILRGAEDLGGGLSAGFWLEAGLALDTGSSTGTTVGGATPLFDRRSTLSLASKTLGELRLGRDYVPTYTVWVRHDPFSHVGVAGSNNFAANGPIGPIRAAFGTNPNTTVRANNTVQILLPSGLGGFEGGLLAAPDENGTAANGFNQLVGARLGWASSRFGVVAAYMETTNSLTSGSNEFTDTVVAGNAAFGDLRLTAAWRQFKFTTSKQTNTLVGAIYSIGASDIKASIIRGNLSGRVGTTSIDANDATQVGLGYVYNLSRRSALYATFSRIGNEGNATFVVPGGPAHIAGNTSTGYEAGFRHNF